MVIRRRHQLAKKWLERAESNLKRAEQPPIPGTAFEDYCFDAQQAAEKALKSIFVHEGITFPFTHDLEDLVSLFRRSINLPVPEFRNEIAFLSDFAATTRYPGWGEPVNEAELVRARKMAQQTVARAKAVLQSLQEETSP